MHMLWCVQMAYTFPVSYVWSPPQESPDGGYLHRLQAMADIFSLCLRPLVPRHYPYFSQIREYQRMIDQRLRSRSPARRAAKSR